MKRQKTLGVVVQKIREEPPAFRAGVVWGATPWIAGAEEDATPEAAVSTLEDRLRRLGYEPTVILFDTLEEAQAEGRRRLAAEDFLRDLGRVRHTLPEVLAGEGAEADTQDHENLGRLDGVLRALKAVAGGRYDDEKRAHLPPILDGRIVCPECGPDYPDAYFTATADALATAYLSPTGALTTWKDVSVSEERYGDLQCGSCGKPLGDMRPEDLEKLDP